MLHDWHLPTITIIVPVNRKTACDARGCSKPHAVAKDQSIKRTDMGSVQAGGQRCGPARWIDYMPQ
jgi:hypothetical protein